MKPVSSCEIVVDEGEYLYRKGRHLSQMFAMFLV